jgi:hypothetical protein
MIERAHAGGIDLDGRTFCFTVETREPLRRGETVIIREVVEVGGRLEIHAVTERALREEADKLTA